MSHDSKSGALEFIFISSTSDTGLKSADCMRERVLIVHYSQLIACICIWVIEKPGTVLHRKPGTVLHRELGTARQGFVHCCSAAGSLVDWKRGYSAGCACK